MLFSSLITVGSLLAATGDARYTKRSDGVVISSKKPVARQAPSEIAVTSAVLPIDKVSSMGTSTASQAVRRRAMDVDGNTTDLTSLATGQEFSAAVTFGTEVFNMIVDTGSSDTWVVENDFTCYNLHTEYEAEQSECNFGALYTMSSTFVPISGEEFEIAYGDGEQLLGTLGTEQVSLAGMTLDTEVAVVSKALWQGDGATSGIMGLAYPAITSAYSGQTQETYNPIFTNMFAQGLIANDLFSLIIERNVSGSSGYLAFGGVPDVPFTQNFTATPIIITSLENVPRAKDYYTINIDSVSMNAASLADAGGSAIEYIVDSGTTLNYVPTSVADAIAAAYTPAAQYSQYSGVYIVDCDTTAPAVSVDVAGMALPINPLDMILDAGEGMCISGFTDGGSNDGENLFILGDTFLKNVVSVFDVGASMMQFASREFYASNDTI